MQITIKHKKLFAALAIPRILPRFPEPPEVLGKMYIRTCDSNPFPGRCSAGENMARIFPANSQVAETGCSARLVYGVARLRVQRPDFGQTSAISDLRPRPDLGHTVHVHHLKYRVLDSKSCKTHTMGGECHVMPRILND